MKCISIRPYKGIYVVEIMQCEMCGSEKAEFIVKVEGTEMSLGQKCAKTGQILRRIPGEQPKKQKQQNAEFRPRTTAQTEPIEVITKDYANIIKTAREKRGLKQEDFAKLLHEKESVLHSIETGHREPRIELARKLEKHLKIKLVEQYEEKTMKFAASKDEPLTAGHLITIKHRKKK